MVHTPSLQRGTLLVSAVAVLGLLTACGSPAAQTTPPRTASGTAGPATEDTAGSAAPSSGSASAATGGAASSAKATGGTSGATTTTGTTARCHTSELSASVGRNNPGAGQENFPIVLTNKSARTCTVRGYPGAAFVSASGAQLGPDPKRSSGSPATVTLKPGQSAWAGLSFSNPEISGAKTATPAALVVTPPDERDPLKVTWTAGEVPVSGNASAVFLTVFSAGTGA
ncbi:MULTISPECIES: DUF4232 domain-containing protein [Streptomyces]|uniref:DUF4232 domain-containing protein n=1 Tax=Streptomyces TaxID=1883 RepID=UPI00292FDCA8|nr:DUF4232 domain-containing protein [Streptomyces sp. NEAU-HV9]